MAKKYTLAELRNMFDSFRQTLAKNAEKIDALRAEEASIQEDLSKALVSGDDRAYKTGIDKLVRNQTEAKILEDFNAKAPKRGGGSMFSDADVLAAWEADREKYRKAGLEHVQTVQQLIDAIVVEAEKLGKLKAKAQDQRNQYIELMVNPDRVPNLGADVAIPGRFALTQYAKSDEQRGEIMNAVNVML